MPYLLFLLSVATLVAVSSTSKAAGPKGRSQTFTLDANMPDALRNQVLAALVSGTDPATLDAFATALQAQYPLSAGLLHAKAVSLRAGVPGTPLSPPVLPVVSNDPGGPPLDSSMAPAMVAFVHTELASETDPNKLLALASTIGAQYPLAAALLAQRAAVLNVQPQPWTPTVPPVPTPSPAIPSGPALNMPGLDPGMPPDVAQAVMGELIGDSDPVKLEAYAQQIQSRYPLAANLLASKAKTILALQQQPSPLPAPVVGPTDPGITTASYTVQDGDYPWKIATKITGHGARWPELVAANPKKTRARDGNFATLLPGEKLTLPAAWGASPPLPSQPAPAVAIDPSAAPVIAPQPSQAVAQAPALFSPNAVVLAHTVPPSPSQVTTAASYKVMPGDSPSKIAAALVHDGNRWHELVASNPQKKRAPNGNFATLVPGELLQLPPSWVSGAARSTPAQGGA